MEIQFVLTGFSVFLCHFVERRVISNLLTGFFSFAFENTQASLNRQQTFMDLELFAFQLELLFSYGQKSSSPCHPG